MNDNFKVEIINSSEVKLYPINKDAFFEYKRFKEMVKSLYSFFTPYFNLSKDFKSIIEDFYKKINLYDDNKEYFIYDIEKAKYIVEILEFLISEDIENKFKDYNSEINNDKINQNNIDFQKAKRVLHYVIEILKELNNQLLSLIDNKSTNSH